MKAIDTSALVEFLLNTERFAAASDYFDDELIATDLVVPESLNALRRIALRHPRTARRVDRSVEVLGQLPIDFVPLQALTDEISRQVEQDIPIWEHKIFQPNPILCDGDGPINMVRKWYSQFYMDAADVPADLVKRKTHITL